jgi:hypothetical protein
MLLMRRLLCATALMALFVCALPSWAAAPAAKIGQNSYDTLAMALEAAKDGDTITLLIGTHTERVTLNKDGITLNGAELARTLISGSNSGTSITIDGAKDITLSNITLIKSDTTIKIKNDAEVTLRNCVLYPGKDGVAVHIEDNSDVDILHNTFYTSDVAIDSDSEKLEIKNNIFDNVGGIFPKSGGADPDKFTAEDNRRQSSTSFGAEDLSAGTQDEYEGLSTFAFVDTEDYDFHHTSSAGSTFLTGEDKTPIAGAYSGSQADTIPFPPQDVKATAKTNENTVTLSWSKNNAARMSCDSDTASCGYKIYYDNDASSKVEGIITLTEYKGRGAMDGATAADSGYKVVSTSSSVTLINLSPSITKPASPVIDEDRTEFSSGKLKIYWAPVAEAAGYKVTWSETDNPSNTDSKDVDDPETSDDMKSYTITGLENLVSYDIRVIAYAKDRFYFAITAFDAKGESDAIEEVYADLGNPVDGDPSAAITAFPEEIIGHPNLPNEGCFIATAAFGHYSEAHVHVLRDFRDRYLVTSSPGQALVAWYYRQGPYAAHWLNQHDRAKPWVRAALAPMIGAAGTLLGTSTAEKWAMALLLTTLLFTLRRRTARIRLAQVIA